MENYYELLYMRRMDDEWAERMLLRQSMPIVYAEVNRTMRAYKRMEIYRDDFLQEGMIAIDQAADAFREDQNASFPTFLTLVVKRRIFSLLRHVSSKSFVQYHDTIGLENMVADNEGVYDVFGDPDRMRDPSYCFYYNEALERFQKLMETMTLEERETYRLWQEGYSYKEASEILRISYKTFDGRMQRLRKKLKNTILDGEEFH